VLLLAAEQMYLCYVLTWLIERVPVVLVILLHGSNWRAEKENPHINASVAGTPIA
jgi:hypothetical protein